MEDLQGVDALLAAARALIARLTPLEAAAAQAAGSLIIDTRCTDDIEAEGSIPGSIPIPRTVLEWRADPGSPHRDPRVSGGRPLIVVCNDGYSSSLAAANLVQLGHSDAADLIGGYRAWVAAGLPTSWNRPRTNDNAVERNRVDRVAPVDVWRS